MTSPRIVPGIKARLFVAFCAMAAMTAVASAVAWYAFIGIDRAMTRIVADSVLGMAASLRLAEKSAEIAATAPALIASSSDDARAREQGKLIERVKELVDVTESLRTTGIEDERIKNLTLIEAEITTELENLNAAVEQRLYYSGLRKDAVAGVAKAHNGFLAALTPMVDDAAFELVLTSEDVTAEGAQAVTGLIEGGVGELQQILTINAEGNLAAGLLNEVAHIEDPDLVQPNRERFLAAAAAVERNLRQLPDIPESEQLSRAAAALLDLGVKEDSLFDAREKELRAFRDARNRLQAKREQLAGAVKSAHEALLETLTPMVDDAAFELVLASEDATAESSLAITGLVEGGVSKLNHILTINAEGNLAAGLLNEAANIGDPVLIEPIRERFQAASAAVSRSLDALPESTEKGRLQRAGGALLDLGAGPDNLFDAREQELRSPAGARRALTAKREQIAGAVRTLHKALLDILTPMVDDAAFELILTSEDVTAESARAITGLVEGGVSNLHQLLAINAESNLAAGLLNEAARIDEPALIQPIRERFLAAAAAIERNLRQLPDSPETADLQRVSTALLSLGAMDDNLFVARERELRALAAARDSLQVKREQMAVAVKQTHGVLLETLTPMVDDAAFELVLAGEDVTAEGTQAITGLVEGGVATLRVLLTLRADGNLLAGLLNEAAGVLDPNRLQPLKERFIAATSHVEKTASQIPKSVAGDAVLEMTRALIAYGREEGNIFDLRREELRQTAAAEASLEANRVLALRLGEEVAELVTSAQSSSDAAALHSAQAIGNGKLLLAIITALSAVGATIIVLYYVAPRIVTPLESITAVMTELAGGDTSVDVPYRDRQDEIGRMAHALGVFRDITIEVQESNLRDLQTARRRLADAINSITEGFSLYDSEDRLVVCNNRYRTLLYPDMADEITPGMSFESIIRRAAERGYVRDAEGRIEEWIAERLAQHREPGEPKIQQRKEGQWLLISERRTDDGSTVAVYSDITDMKQREEELAEKSSTLESLSSQLAKYLSPQVYESIFTGKQEVAIASQRKKLTVFFSDIAGFTETTDKLESEELTALLNHYLTEMSRIALTYGATVDKYVGDAIVIFFGDPETRGVKQDALACVEMAIAMRKKMLELEKTWRDAGIENPLKCRIGISTGYCTVGNFGSEDRMDYTIIGGGVNLASRLESAATPGEILISYETYAHVKDRIRCREGETITVKGIAYPVATFQVDDLYDNLVDEGHVVREELPNLKIDLDLDAMTKKDRHRAETALRQALDRLSGYDGQAGNKRPASS